MGPSFESLTAHQSRQGVPGYREPLLISTKGPYVIADKPPRITPCGIPADRQGPGIGSSAGGAAGRGVQHAGGPLRSKYGTLETASRPMGRGTETRRGSRCTGPVDTARSPGYDPPRIVGVGLALGPLTQQGSPSCVVSPPSDSRCCSVSA